VAGDLRQRLERHKFGLLLLSLLAVVLVPLAVDNPDAQRATFLWVLVLAAAVHAVSSERKHTWMFAAVGVFSYGGRLLTVLGLGGNYQGPVDAAGFVGNSIFGVMIVYVVFSAVLASPQVRGDTVLGAITVYMLIGMLWTNFYALVYLADANAFNFPAYAQPGASGIYPEYTFGYYSFVTLTTLGYGDVTPISFRARTLSWLEAFVGVTYIATVIAFLVGQVMADRQSRAR